jgi:hypothetical protein
LRLSLISTAVMNGDRTMFERCRLARAACAP